MRFAVLTSSFPLGPSDKSPAGLFARDFVNALSASGHEVVVVTQARPGMVETDPGHRVLRFDWRGRGNALVNLKLSRPGDVLFAVSYFFSAWRALRKLRRDYAYDRCLALWAVPGGLVAWLALFFSRVPYSVWCLGSDIWVYGRARLFRPLVRMVLNGADRVFADGEGLRKEVEEISGGDCWFLPTSRVLPKPAARPASFPVDRKNLVFVGRYHPAKGPDVLIDAVARLSAADRDRICVHLFGEGPDRPELERKIAELPAGLVRLGKAIGPEEVSTALAHADFCMIPSRADSIPVVLSESLQGGTPVIAAEVGDLPALVRGFGLGYLFPVGDSAALADRIRAATASPKEDYRAGIERALRMFDVRGAAKRFIDVLDRAPVEKSI